jgi:hypothetical protein
MTKVHEFDFLHAPSRGRRHGGFICLQMPDLELLQYPRQEFEHIARSGLTEVAPSALHISAMGLRIGLIFMVHAAEHIARKPS